MTTPTLTEAIEHLRQFRYTFNEGEAVDEESGLSADDLTVILETLDGIADGIVARDPEDHPTA